MLHFFQFTKLADFQNAESYPREVHYVMALCDPTFAIRGQ